MRIARLDNDPELNAILAARPPSPDRQPDIFRVLLYRPELFGRTFSTYTHEVLRGSSEWTVGERELMAAMVSTTNACQFCMGSHAAVASRLLGEEVVEAALRDWRTAPVSEPLRRTLGFLTKLTAKPNEVTAADIQELRQANLSDDAIRTAIHICCLFCVINRVADAMGFQVPTASAFRRMAAALVTHGYAPQ